MQALYYVVPSPYDAQHHGVLGMHWGIRRYQPYSVVPRGSGEGGVERIAKKMAKKNVKAAYKNIKRNYLKTDKYESKMANYEYSKNVAKSEGRTLKAEKIAAKEKAYKEKNEPLYKERMKVLDEAFDKFSESEKVLGKEKVDKMISGMAGRDIALNSVKGVALTAAGQAALALTTGIVVVHPGLTIGGGIVGAGKSILNTDYISSRRSNSAEKAATIKTIQQKNGIEKDKRYSR